MEALEGAARVEVVGIMQMRTRGIMQTLYFMHKQLRKGSLPIEWKCCNKNTEMVSRRLVKRYESPLVVRLYYKRRQQYMTVTGISLT